MAPSAAKKAKKLADEKKELEAAMEKMRAENERLKAAQAKKTNGGANGGMDSSENRKMPAKAPAAKKQAKLAATFAASAGTLAQQFASDKTKIKGKSAPSEAKLTWKSVIDSGVKLHIFSKVKFLKTEKAQIEAAKHLFYAMEMDKEGVGEDKRQEWIDTYHGMVGKAVNYCRGYVTSQMQSVAQKWHKKHGSLPTEEQFLACLNRTLPLKNEDDQALAIWYVDEFLPKSCGSSTHFPEEHRRYYPLSSKYPPNSDNAKAMMNVSTEAFAVTAAVGNLRKWQTCIEAKKEYPDKVLTIIQPKFDDDGNPIHVEKKVRSFKIVGSLR